MNRRHPSLRPLPSLLTGVLVLIAGAACVVPTGCSGKTAAASKVTGRCTPGNYVFCRCQDRTDGSKLCKEDGDSFGKCEPCETDQNPEVPEGPDSGTWPPDPFDGGADAPDSGPAKCGDKTVQDGEDCDDGNTVEDDGCDNGCKLAGTDPLASRSCPGMDVHVWSKPVTWTTNTAGSTNTGSTKDSCGLTPVMPGDNIPTTGAAASDRVLMVTAHKTGTMTVLTTDTDYNSFLYVAETCVTGPNVWLACANRKDGVGGETMTFPVTNGKVYAVFLDGAGISGQQGVLRVTLSIL